MVGGGVILEPQGRWERWGVLVLFIVTCLVTVGGIAAVFANRPQPATFTIMPPPPTVTPAPTPTAMPVVVYVTGEVVQPNQLLTLSAGSRVSDVVTTAGGFTSEADIAKVNLAAIIQDGQQVHIPAVGEIVVVTPAQSTGGLIDINTATTDQLTELPGIGPALAARIIAYREENGAFKSLDDLDLVSGIGPSIIANIGDLVTFGGF